MLWSLYLPIAGNATMAAIIISRLTTRHALVLITLFNVLLVIGDPPSSLESPSHRAELHTLRSVELSSERETHMHDRCTCVRFGASRF